ncbi:M20 aminoacylase family protein [Rhodospirillum rubrum]|uniref:Peptidase M20D, amidohydrolase n=1 Tax=Rhodospirillum rubrum (strain ATCC 11170 / ATH 1.1.1 / DSM 467 / LMG 4362 / NCIMB 8255 / S1) TaxID=269796 RepID=Q2RVR0_RHORT|nr:M20 aminoacylase family protein [Rhodospirillum rubrum]ABC21785.1 Peptidase M20D, amidohydrolase [Rhodospirillum rubrum ATCC 11170]AEO47485.1 peptidase M20D, amidohydrolase [Rhodospirillum rubrum F11]MBK5953343.1 amidohydrolase [Rhodospirillum rubrum]QXG81449.1 amidohydrolase [Rhodospirillum rubrum]HAQ00418.1 amidohydrolase [Rhodospirillum rubrum]
MSVIPQIAAFAQELGALRHDIHAHPELGFEERRTAALVAEKLAAWGIEVHTGIGKTGVVGVLKGRLAPGAQGARTIGLRADMDALPMDEESGCAYASTHAGRFHGCGHDGHTTMLLGAARYLAATRAFAGTVVFIFQPGEEGVGGAKAMLADGLFTRFPCDELYAMHNWPAQAANTVMVKPGPAMAGSDFFDIRIKGKGSHGAMPQFSRDPIIVATALVQALQSVVSRNVAPTGAAVLSVTQIHSGSAYNVVPDGAVISGTMRFFDAAVGDLIRQRMRALAAGLATSFGVEITVDLRPTFTVLVNDPALSRALVEAAGDVVGGDRAMIKEDLEMGSEDFADMLRVVPGAYCTLGHSTAPETNKPLHNPGFVFDDAILPVGASLYARIVERRLIGQTS